MKVSEVRKVMSKYGQAWETQDPSLILECFTRDAIYQENPLSKPYRGHTQIKDFWNRVVVEETTGIKFRLMKCYVSDDGKTGFAEWRCKNTNKGRKGTMVGVTIIKMKGPKITYLNEYWNTKRYGPK